VLFIVDGDALVYRAGFATQQSVLRYSAELPTGEVLEGTASSPELLQSQGSRIVATWKEVVAEPLSHALHLISRQLAAAAIAVAEHEGAPAPGLEYAVYLTGKGNYRERVARIRPYKGNRDPEHRPERYHELREALCARYGARIVDGREADDEVSIQARKLDRNGGYCVVSMDKDLEQIPGLHYDLLTKQVYTISDSDARLVLWKQILAGDRVDNVPGCFRIGARTAENIITQWMAAGARDTELWEGVVALYKESQRKRGCPYATLDAASVALETAQLVYLQQRLGELWMPPGVAHGYVDAI
jgi:5'-3' exonuclease